MVTGVEGHGLKPWREVITPHKDVRDGKMRGAEFAADLYWVSRGEGSREYVDPVEFFRRTYLTEGLRDLLAAAARRIGGDRNASPVWNLQTNFGGGKTHSMLALYHLLSGTPLRRVPGRGAQGARRDVTLPAARRAVLVGNHFKAGAATPKPDGTRGTDAVGRAGLAARVLGGRAGRGAARVRDRRGPPTRPGPTRPTRSATLIAAYAPCLILIDEWVAYARQLYGRDDLAGGTFDTQFTFAQTLTEVVKAVPGALLVVSIPASSAAPTGRGGRAGRDRHRGRRAQRGAGAGPAAAGDPPDRRPVAARVAGGVVRDRPAAAVRGAGRRRAGGHRRGRPGVHRLLREEPGRVPVGGRRAVV